MPQDVFFIPLEDGSSVSNQVDALKQLLNQCPFDKFMAPPDKVGIKIHVGEKNNDTHVAPELVKVIASRVKRNGAFPFLTETSTLYRGMRHNAISHLTHAFSQGFNHKNAGAPFIMADGLNGDSEIEVPIQGKIYSKVSIAREAVMANALILVTHVTGHMQTGMGAGLKNLGMGLASRRGKMRQHSSAKPLINFKRCTFCGECIRWCPEEAIAEVKGKAFINQEACIGCGECLAVCRFESVHYNWGTPYEELQKRIVEHASALIRLKQGKLFFIHVLINMTKDCDCLHIKQDKLIPDIGILASEDVVALDQAVIDLTSAACSADIGRMAYPEINPLVQLEYAEELGLGSRAYRLVKV